MSEELKAARLSLPNQYSHADLKRFIEDGSARVIRKQAHTPLFFAVCNAEPSLLIVDINSLFLAKKTNEDIRNAMKLFIAENNINMSGFAFARKATFDDNKEETESLTILIQDKDSFERHMYPIGKMNNGGHELLAEVERTSGAEFWSFFDSKLS